MATAQSRPLPKLSTNRGADLATVAVVIVFCVIAGYVRWCKLSSLIMDDPGVWLDQVARAAKGELPYRDFSYNYPPLSIYALAWVARIFGPTFETIQAAMDILSATVVALSYILVRMLLPRRLHAVTLLVLIFAGATALTKFTLFSLLTYSPTLLFGTIGLLLVLIGAVDVVQRERLRSSNGTLLFIGTAISALSKPETFLAAFATLVLIAAIDFKRRHGPPTAHAALIGGCGLVVAAAYAIVARKVGFDNLKDGIMGYGLATFACPWWPTGLGVFGAAGALGEAAALGALLSWPVRRGLRARYGRSYSLLLCGAIPGAALAGAYYTYLSARMLALVPSQGKDLLLIGQTILGTGAVTLPVMWVSIVCWLVLMARLVRGKGLSVPDEAALVFLTAPVVMCTRGLFGTTLFPYSEVSAICYAFFLIAAPYLLWRFLSESGAQSYAVYATAAVCLAYCFIRLVGGYSLLISDARYTPLQTNAGIVNLLDNDGSAEIYRYTVEHTSPGSAILEIPYGGGIYFAAQRRNPLFTTQFQQLRMPERLQQEDLRRFLADPPSLVVAMNAPRYGTTFGYKADMKCPCPRLVWEPDEPSWDPEVEFPIVPQIEQNYRAVMTVKNQVLLVRP